MATSEETIREATEVLTALHYELAEQEVRDSPEGFSARKVAALADAGLLRQEMTETLSDLLTQALDECLVDSLVTKSHVKEMTDYLLPHIAAYVQAEKAEAWQEGRNTDCEHECFGPVEHPPNPYREVRDER